MCRETKTIPLCVLAAVVAALAGCQSAPLARPVPPRAPAVVVAPADEKPPAEPEPALAIQIEVEVEVQPPAPSLRMPGIFSDNMVLQQGMPVPVWGWADDDRTISVSFRDQYLTTTARDGVWQVKLNSLAPGGPDVLTVSGSTTLEFTNVLVGEVWICGGQSNMEWPISKSFEPEHDIRASWNPTIRLFTVPKEKAGAPADDVRAAWRECAPRTVSDFSAVAYYFGRELQRSRNVPIGLIQVAWGGSPAEAWMNEDALRQNPRYQTGILDHYEEGLRRHTAVVAELEREKAAARQRGEDLENRRSPRAPWKPAELYNGMLAPLIPYAFKGVIWYQGESNAPRAHQYRSLFPDLIGTWRRDWGQGDFPFLAVQLAPFKPIKEQTGESDWAELREAQLLAAKSLPKVGLVITTDIGDEHDIHPQRKAPVGGRLALAARGIAYEEDIVHSGPVFREMRVTGDRVILTFDHVGSGLESRGGSLRGFSIAGADRKFVWALADIEKETVVVRSPNVDKPVAVRYGWADYPVVNLWNKEGLPATPFRTDDFPMITAPASH